MNSPSVPQHERQPISRGRFIALVVLFGTLYFAQGLIEPTAGLLHQPMQSQMDDWSMSVATISTWMFLLGLPWTLKPVFGLLTDFVPLLGYRRWTYLIGACGATVAAYFAVFSTGFLQSHINEAFALLVVATAGVAFADVVIDGLAVEEGQPAGITGQLQSVQWGTTSVATIAAGSLGGYLAETSELKAGFLICACLASVTFLVAILLVTERRRHAAKPSRRFWHAIASLLKAVRSPLVIAVGGFLFLWNFNPFSSTVQQLYLTNELGFSEQFYGNLISIYYAAGVPACLLYGLFCRRVPLGWLVHASIATGVVATLAYWGVVGPKSAVFVTTIAGFAYILGVVIQLDLAARVVPTESAATVFALLMALSNTGISSGIFVGGHLYDYFAELLGAGRHLPFDLLVAAGALTTAACWLLVPWLRRCGLEWK